MISRLAKIANRDSPQELRSNTLVITIGSGSGYSQSVIRQNSQVIRRGDAVSSARFSNKSYTILKPTDYDSA